MINLSKKQKKEVKHLLGLGYERELQKALKELYESFKDWQDKQMDCWELEQAIHIFHNRTARELWKKYNVYKPGVFELAGLYKQGIIKKEEISKALMDKIKKIKKSFNL